MEGDINSEEDAGIVPRSVKAILDMLEGSGTEFTIRVSFLELYNEELQDLLNTSGDKKLKLCEDVKKGVICQNLEEITVLTVDDIFDILQRGIKQRQTAATLCNKNSSRSHSIFTMKIMIKECNVDGEEVVRHGQLNLVDLAGSECVGRSGAKDDRAREAGSINQSLLTLGRVITALVDHHGHVPYRDSKLTRLLQESLGGKAKTCIIATLSASQSAVEETMSTLDYAYRAKNIKNQPTVNQKLIKKVVMKEYFAEIEQLKTQLLMTREKNGIYLDPAEYYAMEGRLAAQDGQILECEAALKARNEEFKAVKAENIDLSTKLEASETESRLLKVEAVKTQEKLEKTVAELTETTATLQATQAVVSEQATTEKALFQTGTELQVDLRATHHDVDKLLVKVENLSKQESIRLFKVSEFVDKLNQTNAALLEQISSFAAESTEHSSSLCQGVDQILVRGKETCSTLKTSIDQALTTLVGDAETARDSMTQSCSGLKTHLKTTNGHVEKTLRSLQEQLSNWLGEADVSLKQARQHLQEQQTQISSFGDKLKEQQSAVVAQSKAFLLQQEALNKTASRQATELKKQLKIKFDTYEKTVKSQGQEASSVMRKQAEQLEKTVSALLKEMVQKNSTALEAASSLAASLCADSQQKLSSDLAEMATTQSSMLDACNTHAKTLDTAASTNGSNNRKALEGLLASRTTADGVLTGISGTVGTKRKFLDTTVTGLVGEVSVAITQGCSSVDSTSETANKVLKDISGAASKMTKSASEAMSSFTTYLGQEGQAISAGLGAHFKAAESHLGGQKRGLTAASEEAAAHNDSIRDTMLISTNTTPTKKTVQPLRERPLHSTRQHSVIMEEARAGTWRLQSYSPPQATSSTPLQSRHLNPSGTLSVSQTAKKRRQQNGRLQQPLGRLNSGSQDELDLRRVLSSHSLGSCSMDSTTDLDAGENVPPSILRCDSGDNQINIIAASGKRSSKNSKTAAAEGDELPLPSNVNTHRRANSTVAQV